MKKYYYFLLISTLSLLILSCQSVPSSPEDIKLYTFTNGKAEPTQNNTQSTTQSGQNNPQVQEYVRNEVVSEQNNVFSIGIPSNYIEKTEVTAQKPIDFWFEYVPDNMELKVNNQTVQRDPTKWETKLSYTQQVTKFNYEAINRNDGMMSYNLHIIPSNSGESVPVKVIQRYKPLN